MLVQKEVTIQTIFNQDIREITKQDLSIYFEKKGLNPIEAALKATKELNIIEKRLTKDLLKSESEAQNTLRFINSGYIKTNLGKMIKQQNSNVVSETLGKIKNKSLDTYQSAYQKINTINNNIDYNHYIDNVKHSKSFIYTSALFSGFYTMLTYKETYEEYLERKERMKKDSLNNADIFGAAGILIASGAFLAGYGIYKLAQNTPEAIEVMDRKMKESVLNMMTFANEASEEIGKNKKMKSRLKFLNYMYNELYSKNKIAFSENVRLTFLEEKVGDDFSNLSRREQKERVNELLKDKSFVSILCKVVCAFFKLFKNQKNINDKKIQQELANVNNKKYKRFSPNKKIVEEFNNNIEEELEKEIKQEIKQEEKKVVIKKLPKKERERRAQIRKKNRLGMRLVPENYALRMK